MEYYKDLIGTNFAVGPVEMDYETRELGSIKLPYFRTEEFSNINKENERLIKSIVNSGENSRAIFLTASGTGAMEATIQNVFSNKDKVLVINGGSFGNRFVELCKIHNIEYVELNLESGHQIKETDLNKYRSIGLTGLLVNIHETSTGVLYDIDLIKRFCDEEKLLLVVDSISSLLADKYDMGKNNIDVTIIGCQKALALPPGLSIIIMSEKAIERVKNNSVSSMYFNLKKYLNDGERGQTPFTPAVGIILQLNEKLNRINDLGVEYYIKNTEKIANDFRKRIKEFPFEIVSENLSNTLTPLYVKGNMTAYDIFLYLKDNYNLFLCPNGGELKDKLIRVGHIGNLSIEDNDKLINALYDMKENGLI